MIFYRKYEELNYIKVLEEKYVVIEELALVEQMKDDEIIEKAKELNII